MLVLQSFCSFVSVWMFVPSVLSIWLSCFQLPLKRVLVMLLLLHCCFWILQKRETYIFTPELLLLKISIRQNAGNFTIHVWVQWWLSQFKLISTVITCFALLATPFFFVPPPPEQTWIERHCSVLIVYGLLFVFLPGSFCAKAFRSCNKINWSQLSNLTAVF